MRLQRRLNLGFAALLVLFTAFLVVQFGVGAQLREDHHRRSDQIATAREANRLALQGMTDAETGLRGFQLTDERLFLEPYQNGRGAALVVLARAAAQTRDRQAVELLEAERQAVDDWLDQYAIPIATGSSPVGMPSNALGKQLFDRLRTVNSAADDAIAAEWRSEETADRRMERTLAISSGALVVAVLIAGYLLVRVSRRQLLVPLARVGDTIRRQAAGDRSARVAVDGAVELRTVVDALNDLAAQTEQLLAAEKTRSARAGLRQTVAAELQREDTDPAITGYRVVAQIGAALGAGTVRSRLYVPGTGQVAVCWPAGAPDLDPAIVDGLSDGPVGEPVTHADGGLSVTLGGDAECPGGYLYVCRADGPDRIEPSERREDAASSERREDAAGWTDSERRLLAGVAREIERALRQQSVRVHQDLLISELRMLDQRKDVFIQTVTHELRTPLTSILGYTEMLAEDDDELSPTQRRSVNAVLRNAHRLQNTIGDLLLLDRPATAADTLTEPVDLSALTAAVHAELGTAAQAKELRVTVDAEPAWVRGDRTQLQRALRKLVENAIKFTPAGGSVTCRCGADEETVTIVVIDTGIGIPAADVSGLFTPFHRAGNAMDQAVQGPGLGLAIVRDIVRDHGGTISVESVVGRGSTFTVTLPAVPVPAPVPVS
ncbi:ATP-binding protein [Actinoplanes awajinensis]|uniref:histidine kinase n=1 Tax=Actinoplanes awajinensis subsp. mycoplanecinus TaxID=135947 RepID=A0A117MK10_9ACTN|nr:ATP-binding protein [Actinoplanes awajinensis]KUL21657.1 histidine kinase [Actinoplanes awajinensis subsp. mycoplanecinus]